MDDGFKQFKRTPRFKWRQFTSLMMSVLLLKVEFESKSSWKLNFTPCAFSPQLHRSQQSLWKYIAFWFLSFFSSVSPSFQSFQLSNPVLWKMDSGRLSFLPQKASFLGSRPQTWEVLDKQRIAPFFTSKASQFKLTRGDSSPALINLSAPIFRGSLVSSSETENFATISSR